MRHRGELMRQSETWKWRFLALNGALWGMVQEAITVLSAAEVDDGEAFVSAFAARKHALSRRDRRFYSTFSGAKWRFWRMVHEAVLVHSASEVDVGKAFVSAFAVRKVPGKEQILSRTSTSSLRA
jgi:hypothetical protein